jgi:hypothetical protein
MNVLYYMREHHGITTLEANRDLGVTRLSARILELKEKGYDIDGVFVEVTNRYGDTCNVKRYFLKSEAR